MTKLIKQINLDLDDVLVDFKGAVCHLFDQPKSILTQSIGWDLVSVLDITQEQLEERIFNSGWSWWRSLSCLPWMHELVTLANEYADNVRILTAPMNHSSCRIGKNFWIGCQFGHDFTDYVITTEKKRFDDGNRCLIIDDKQSTCESYTRSILFPGYGNPLAGMLRTPDKIVPYVERELQRHCEEIQCTQ